MEQQDSYGTTIAKAFGKTVFDKLFTWGLPLVMAASGIAAKLTAPGVLQNALVMLAVLCAVGFVVVIYFNHKFTAMGNRMRQLEEQRIYLSQSVGNLRSDFGRDLNIKATELKEYLEIVGWMNHYRINDGLKNTTFGSILIQTDTVTRLLTQERLQVEQWFQAAHPEKSPRQIRAMMDLLYADVEPVGAN